MPDIDLRTLFDLRGRTGIVTGGAGILGKRICPGLLEHGANVAIADVDRQAASELAQSLDPNFSGRVLAVECDVSRPDSVRAMVADTVRRFGRIDFLLNNAATAAKDPADYYAPFEDYTLDEWRRVMSINLDGVFLVAQAVGRQMREQGSGGSIVHTASIYGVMASDNRIYEGSTFKGYAINNPAPYGASKAGVVGLTRWLASYWAPHHIRVNAVAPGGVESFENETFTRNYSRRVPMARMAQADEIVGAMVYLVSDASTYVTGQCLMVDGGLSAW
jgi:NAD(P)-dependent dehydrogenase (short-subunit alcohol dehydrogenase family)